MKVKNFTFISKTVFFPKEGILAIGDLHLGYEPMLREQGIMLNFNQLKNTKKELEIIIKKIKALFSLKKIVLLGDMKHNFGFQKSELFDLRNFLKFLENFLSKEDIILIRGNHDKFTLNNYELRDVYVSSDGEIAFTHGHLWFKELEDKKVKTIVIGHIHPAIVIGDKVGIKREKYKCFLVGKYKRKQFIVVPSFFPLIAGSEIKELYTGGKHEPIVKNKILKKFDSYVVGKDRIYNFGKYK